MSLTVQVIFYISQNIVYLGIDAIITGATHDLMWNISVIMVFPRWLPISQMGGNHASWDIPDWSWKALSLCELSHFSWCLMSLYHGHMLLSYVS